jgi:hypothetical protein
MKTACRAALAFLAFGVLAAGPVSAAVLTYEAENVAYANSGTGATLQTDANCSGGKWVSLDAENTGSWLEFTLTSVPAGTYTVQMSYKTNNNRGQLTTRIDGATFGGTLDQYAALPSVYPTATLGTVNIATTGDHKIRLVVSGKNSASSSYVLSADKFTLTSSGSVTPTPTPGATATPTPGSTATPTPRATARPTATPTPVSGWTLKWTADPARGMGSWEGVEDDRAGSHTSFGPHIRAEGDLFHWYMHMVDRDGSDRQRHEVKGMNQAGNNLQMLQGETWKFVYEMFMPTTLTGGSNFTHIHQMKMVSDAGSSGTPLSTLSTSLSGSTETLVMRSLNGGTNFNPIPLAPLRGHWIEIELEYKIGFGGYARMCVRDGGATVTDKTMTGVDMWINEGTSGRYARPKWGIYRSLQSSGLKDTYLQIRNLRAYKK